MSQRKAHMDMLGITMLIGFSILLGLNQALVKIVNDGFSPVFQAGFRSVCAFIPVLVFAHIMKRKLSLTDGSLRWGIVNGLLFSMEFVLLFVALDYTTVARVSMFFYVMPVWVALSAHFLIPEEPLNRNKIAGLTLSICGIAVAFSGNLGAAGEKAWLGDLLALFGGMFWAAIAMVTRLKLHMASSEMNLLYQLALSGLLLTVISPFIEAPLREPNILIYGVFTFQVLIVVSAGFLLWFWALSTYPVSNMTSFGLLTPIFGVFFGWLLFDDPITPTLGVALLLAGGGIVLVNRPIGKSRASG